MIWTKIATVESENRPGVRYDVKRNEAGQLGCDCPAFRFK